MNVQLRDVESVVSPEGAGFRGDLSTRCSGVNIALPLPRPYYCRYQEDAVHCVWYEGH